MLGGPGQVPGGETRVGRCWWLPPNSGASYLTKQPVLGQEVHNQHWEWAHLLQSQNAGVGGVSVINEHDPWEVATAIPILQGRKLGWERGGDLPEVTGLGSHRGRVGHFP